MPLRQIEGQNSIEKLGISKCLGEALESTSNSVTDFLLTESAFVPASGRIGIFVLFVASNTYYIELSSTLFLFVKSPL